ncbi:MAG: hypothetical protein ABFD64_03110 [Armatimonadota bacterium]
MRRVVLVAVLALFVVCVGAVNAETVSTTLYPGFNLVGPAAVPLDPSPTTVFKSNAGAALDLSNLVRYDSVLKSYISYDELFPEDYGNVLLGEGAWLAQSSQIVWQYDGAPNGLGDTQGNNKTDMWISLPKAGFSLIGNPFNNKVMLANIKVTNGSTTVGWDEAVGLCWLDTTMTGYDGVTHSYFDVGTDDVLFDHVTLDPFHGYWIHSSIDNLALIIPASAIVVAQ